MENEITKMFEKIQENANRIESNLEKIQKNSYAIEILGDYKTESKRLAKINKKLFVIIFILICIVIALGACLIVGV